jgi:TonB-dependent SusC/RagA subfamily outer membrane receptor
MKKTLLISTFGIIAFNIAFNASAQSNTFLYSEGLLIPASENIKSPMSAISAISNFDLIFSHGNSKIKRGTALTVNSAIVELNDPLKKNLGMFRSMKIYVSKGDGSNEILIASQSGISQNLGNSLILTLNKSVATGTPARKDLYKQQGNSSNSIEREIAWKLSGVNSRGGAPLYIIDGVERSGIQGINPVEVVSIDVLKNVSDLAVYGMRAANGVVIIKTKSAIAESPENSLDSFEKGSTVRLRFEYILRYPLKDQTALNVNIKFR